MLPNGVSLDNEPIKTKVSSGPKVFPLHRPQTPPEHDIWNEYKIMLQPAQHLGLNLGTKIDRHREGIN